MISLLFETYLVDVRSNTALPVFFLKLKLQSAAETATIEQKIRRFAISTRIQTKSNSTNRTAQDIQTGHFAKTTLNLLMNVKNVNKMENFLCFIFLFIGSVYGAGELIIFVDLPIELGRSQEVVTMDGDATVQDLVNIMNEELADVERKYHGIELHGKLKPTSLTLADAEFSNRVTVSLVRDLSSLSDIELLFEMLSVYFYFIWPTVISIIL